MKTGRDSNFTPAEIAKLIANAEPLLPYIAIGAFAGLRGAGIQRLDWSELDLTDGFIEGEGRKEQDRYAPPCPDQAKPGAWLKGMPRSPARYAHSETWSTS